MNRRNFVQLVGAGAVTAGAHAANASVAVRTEAGYAPGLAVTSAVRELESSLTAAGIGSGQGAASSQFQIELRRPDARFGPESIEIRGASSGLAVSSGNERGLVYALLDLADRVRGAKDPIAELRSAVTSEKPALRVRSIARLFTSDVEDKPWYNDREMWPQYFAMLAENRFNRFHLAFGIGYDFLQNVTDAYFLFAYPFLLEVPGYNVRATPLPDAERDSNLRMLKYISEQTVAHGLDFQLGLWMHGYKWLNSPNPNYTIEGVNAENHGPYCRDALRLLLKQCPAISGVTFRIHGESGVEEGSFQFWKTVFDGAATCGRKIEIDMHAKGMNQGMLDVAVATGLPVTVSPKYWAEHMGMPYQQAEIREQERPKPGKNGSALMKYSSGSRSFLRYGYGDLLREDRKWGVMTRVWPGTQRLLIWGDPVTAAAHARAFGFCGEDGVEICEPLSFKGRRGSGKAGDRCGYADASLRTRWDWQKFEYTYRVWGRMLYNPAARPDQWQRGLKRRFGDAAPAMETALGNASRILPIVTTAYCPSAANNNYWPEMYLNQAITAPNPKEPYTDSPAPRVFGNASPLDPQMFDRMNDFADALLSGERRGAYSPAEVAMWLDRLAETATRNLEDASKRVRDKKSPDFRRFDIDVRIQAGLGRFFAAKLRAGILYRIYERTGSRDALTQAVAQYKSARATWAELAEQARGVYMADITVGEHPQLRGHWLDRLPAIDADIEAMAEKLKAAAGESSSKATAAIAGVLGPARRPEQHLAHTPPARFRRGEAVSIEAAMKDAAAVRLYYRRVDQAERWVSADMINRDGRFAASIPADYTNSPFPLEYYFEVRATNRAPGTYPGFQPLLNNQPYFVIRQEGANTAKAAGSPPSAALTA